MVGDRWNGSSFADDQYHRICDIIKQVTIVQTEDSWRWSCDKMDSFSVNGLRKHLDGLALPSHYLATRWNKIVPRKLPPNELLDFVNNKDNLHKAKDIIFTIIYTVWWELWRFRNDFIFKPGKKRDVDIVDSIIQFSYLWSRNRYKKQSMRWDDWLKNLLLCL
ncbi:hypothetical protein Tco_0723903 [Tanacetum coccineum]